jgi:Na+-transporting NADH:ubiquinone oxidoreductase subunit NqrF
MEIVIQVMLVFCMVMLFILMFLEVLERLGFARPGDCDCDNKQDKPATQAADGAKADSSAANDSLNISGDLGGGGDGGGGAAAGGM